MYSSKLRHLIEEVLNKGIFSIFISRSSQIFYPLVSFFFAEGFFSTDVLGLETASEASAAAAQQFEKLLNGKFKTLSKNITFKVSLSDESSYKIPKGKPQWE